jgi:hypothetical protein
MGDIAALQKLWNEFYREKKYPRACRDVIDGVHLVLLDADLAGCITTFLSRKSLDSERLYVLKEGQMVLQNVLPKLPDDGKIYFSKLNEIALLALKEINNS